MIVIGERNAGTNYVGQLIEGNLDVTMIRSTDPARFSLASQRLPWAMRELLTDGWFIVTRTVWKHGLLDEAAYRRLAKRGVEAVAVVKHPLTWMLSMHRRPYHRGEMYDDFVEFASTSWKTVGRERLGRRTVANGFEIWAAKAEAVLDLRDRGHIALWRYEDVLDGELGHLTRLAERLGLAAPTATVGIGQSTKAIWGDDRDHAYFREYHRSEQWRDEVPEAVRLVALESCGDVATRLGYEI
jgi:hypothetical protein